MDIMLVGGVSPMMNRLCLKLHKEGHRLYVLSGSRNPGNHYAHVYEQYNFPYDSASVEEVFRSVRPDVTILLGAFDGNFTGEDLKAEAVKFSAGLQNILLSWAAMEKGRLIYLSSVEVYGKSYQEPVPEEVRPSPRGIRPIMLYQGEESCRFFREQLGRDVAVLRIDRLHDVPSDKRDAFRTICGRKCLDAFRDGTVSYRSNHTYGLTYMGDAIEAIYKLVICETHAEWLYHISSSQGCSEEDIAKALQSILGDKLEVVNNTLEDARRIILSNERLKAEFGFTIWCEPQDTVKKSLEYMGKHSSRFLDEDHQGLDPWHKLYYKVMRTLGALVPYIENLVIFIPAFMLNNRATDSQYFSKIDFYLLYVLLFAVVHGQRQATFSAALATAGYLFRQMYGRSGLAVVTDYNTYVWIAEIFILGLVVGYMKDTLQFLREEKEQEVDYLSERVEDIGDINDSNLRVKEDLMNQVINYDYSLGIIYEATALLEQDYPVEILFHAINMIQQVMECQDVSIYRVNEEKYARLFAYSSKKAASMGNTVYIPDKKALEEAFIHEEVYVNQSMNREYPMMAYTVHSTKKMNILILIWSIPFERLTIDETNRLIIIGKMIQQSLKRADRYLESLREQRYSFGGDGLKPDAFEELVGAYRKAGEEKLTEYILLRIDCSREEQEDKIHTLHQMLRETDYIGNLYDGELYVLLTSTDHRGCAFVQKNFEARNIRSTIMEEGGL